MVVAFGRFGPYVRHKGKFYSLPKTDNPAGVGPDRAIELIEAGREKERKKVIKNFSDKHIQVLNGRYGPYIAFEKKNYKIPKGTDPESLTPEQCMEIIEKSKKAKGKKK
jgi:DNA topoisomerase-1